MTPVPVSTHPEAPAAPEQIFRVVETELVAPTRALDPSFVCVDYNSQPVVARRVLALAGLQEFSLSLAGAVTLGATVCTFTILACFFLLPRL